MLAPTATPVAKPRFRFHAKPAETRPGAALPDVIWNLHSILVNPASSRDELQRAKERMLRVLNEAKEASLPQMVVGPATLLPKRRQGEARQGQTPVRRAAEIPSAHPHQSLAARSLYPKTGLAGPAHPVPRTRRGPAASPAACAEPSSTFPTAHSSPPSRCLERWENEGGRLRNHETHPALSL